MNRIDQELREAAKENNLSEVRRLLGVGADVNGHNDYGNTPLHWACVKGHAYVVKELVDHGADVDAKNNRDCTPLHWASRKGHLPVASALVSGGADILAANNYGLLPIHYAVNMGMSEVSKYLLQHYYATTRRLPLHGLLEDLTFDGNPNSMSSDVSPLPYALHNEVLSTDDVVEIIEYLVEQNPESLSSRDRDGSLPLHVACRRGASFTIVQSLVNLYKASVKSITPQGDLPLFLACEKSETSLDTIFILMKLYPDLVLCCIPVVSIAKTMLEDLLSDSNALSQALEENKQLKADTDTSSQQAKLLEKALEENTQLKADNDILSQQAMLLEKALEEKKQLKADTDAVSQQAMLLEKALEEIKELKAENAELKSELSVSGE
jgi:ankyrin repeat protein